MAATGGADRSAQFLRVLGDELRKARRRQGWRRRDLRERLTMEMSLQALATYELGTRAITVVKLLELAEVLEVPLPDLLDRTLRRIEDIRSGAIVDLVVLARSKRPELAPLRHWAQARLAHARMRESTLVKLDRIGIRWLAELSGVPPAELVRLVRDESTVDEPDGG
jgi:transcriptional regulator with XRE-family HTH domain